MPVQLAASGCNDFCWSGVSADQVGLASDLGATSTAGAVGNAAGTAMLNVLNDKFFAERGITDPTAVNLLKNLAVTLAGAAAGSTGGAAAAFNSDANNRQLHPDEKTLAKRLAANSDGKYTVEQVEDAMRAANNKALGEGVDAGAIVDVNGDTATVYDDGAKWSVVWKDGKQQLVQQIPSNISRDLMTYIAQNSGGN